MRSVAARVVSIAVSVLPVPVLGDSECRLYLNLVTKREEPSESDARSGRKRARESLFACQQRHITADRPRPDHARGLGEAIAPVADIRQNHGRVGRGAWHGGWRWRYRQGPGREPARSWTRSKSVASSTC